MKEKIFQVDKKHCRYFICTSANEYLEPGEVYVNVDYKFFNQGHYDIELASQAMKLVIAGEEEGYTIDACWRKKGLNFKLRENREEHSTRKEGST